MKRQLPARFWVELGLTFLSAACVALTIAWPQWIEGIFGFDPDRGDGTTEWGWALALGLATIGCIALARRTWKRSLIVGRT